MKPLGPSRESAPELFNIISKRYDTMNRVMTLGHDLHWRRVLAKHVPLGVRRILDCATGTGDQLLAILKMHPKCDEAWGIDPALKMLDLAGKKFLKTPYLNKVHLLQAKAHEIPFNDGYFDAISISFGIRNVEDVELALKEMRRVLAPNGKLLILECSQPNSTMLKGAHKLFLQHVAPLLGRLIARNSSAYRYLADTVETFPYGEAFCNLVKKAGFNTCNAYPMSFGIATLYVGI
jgi:demethylmenaquinone methyltransferase/2-methoxy-6-polyprenyl-1,4-benzoquinol methylase